MLKAMSAKPSRTANEQSASDRQHDNTPHGKFNLHQSTGVFPPRRPPAFVTVTVYSFILYMPLFFLNCTFVIL